MESRADTASRGSASIILTMVTSVFLFIIAVSMMSRIKGVYEAELRHSRAYQLRQLNRSLQSRADCSGFSTADLSCQNSELVQLPAAGGGNLVETPFTSFGGYRARARCVVNRVELELQLNGRGISELGRQQGTWKNMASEQNYLCQF